MTYRSKMVRKTRKWDKITKKYNNWGGVGGVNSVAGGGANGTCKTDAIKKLIEKSFIGKNELRSLCEINEVCGLDPAVVMDMRHSMINHRKSIDANWGQFQSSNAAKLVGNKQISEEKRHQNHETTLEKDTISKEVENFQRELQAKMKNVRQLSTTKQSTYDRLSSKRQENENNKISTSSANEEEEEDILKTCGVDEFERGAKVAERSVTSSFARNAEDGRRKMVKFNDEVKVDEQQCFFSEMVSKYDREEYHNDDNEDEVKDEAEDFEDFSHLPTTMNVAVTVPRNKLNELNDLNRFSEGDGLEFGGRREDTITSSTTIMERRTASGAHVDGFIVNTQQFLSSTLYISCKTDKSIVEKFVDARTKDSSSTGVVAVSTVAQNKTDTSFDFVVQNVKSHHSLSLDEATLLDENNAENTERDNIITELFKETSAAYEFEMKLLRKYFQKWSVITNLKKITGQNMIGRGNRIQKINNFLNRVRIEKNVLKVQHGPVSQEVEKASKSVETSLMSKKYIRKLKYQQDIIEMQKLKLARQERIISELKFSKIMEATEQSKTEVKMELKHYVRHGTVKFKSKAKCVQLANTLKEDEQDDPFPDMEAHGNCIPTFLARMQARALTRAMRHEEAKEKRLRMEREKEDIKLALEEAKRLEDEKAKQLRYEEMREKRRLEKLEKLQKEKNRLKFIEDTKKANEYRDKKLLKLGMMGMRRLIRMKKKKVKQAKTLRRRIKLRNSFGAWHKLTVSIWEKKKLKADKYHNKYVLRIAIRQWKALYLVAQSKLLTAADLYDLRLTERIFNLWVYEHRHMKMIEERKMLQADAHFHWHLKWKALEHWQRLHIILKIEKETDERRQRWRVKIWELLPDYEPRQDE